MRRVVIVGSILIGVVGGNLLNKFTPSACAAQIQVNNTSWNGSTYDYMSNPVLYLITGDTFSERYALGEDVDWISGPNPYNPAPDNLTIHTQEPNDPNKMATSKKTPHNAGWEVYFGADGSIAGPVSNDIEVMVNDANGLEHRRLIAYDSNNPGTVYELDKTDWNFIPLPMA